MEGTQRHKARSAFLRLSYHNCLALFRSENIFNSCYNLAMENPTLLFKMSCKDFQNRDKTEQIRKQDRASKERDKEQKEQLAQSCSSVP